MAITYPLDILSTFPGYTTGFEPMYRQEQSRTQAGVTYVKDYDDPLWTLSAQSRSLSINELDFWRARLAALENGLQTFLGYSMSRTYPILYPRGSWPTGASFDGVSAELASVNTARTAIEVSGLPSGFTFSVGDYLAIGNDLHQVMESATASGTGLTSAFEVRPRIWPSVEVGSSPPPAAVSVKRPACIMTIDPGSVQSPADPATGRGVISFTATESRSA
jgi:hypothetical protein